MKVLMVTIDIKPEFKERVMVEMEADARGSNNDEPGCRRFDVHADSKDENTVYLYEVYKDRESWEVAHRTAPHYTKWRETVSDWFDGGPQIVELNPVYNAEVGRI